MEDALSLQDAASAALRYRIVRTPRGVAVESGNADDHLFDIEETLSLVRVALERGDEITIDV